MGEQKGIINGEVKSLASSLVKRQTSTDHEAQLDINSRIANLILTPDLGWKLHLTWEPGKPLLALQSATSKRDFSAKSLRLRYFSSNRLLKLDTAFVPCPR